MDQEHFRREEDRKWLKIHTDMMNLVTAQRTNQQVLASLEIEVTKLQEHVDEVDDHLRGVAGKESIDTRVILIEREIQQHEVLLRKISDQFGTLQTLIVTELNEVKREISLLKFQRSMEEKVEKTKTDRFMAWLKFWGPIILSFMALTVPATRLVFENWDKIHAMLHGQKSMSSNVDQWMAEIEKRKKDPKVKRMLKEKYGPGVD